MTLRPYIWLSLIVTCISFTLCCNGYTTNSLSSLMEAIEEEEHKDVNDKTRSFSRRKRYLIFSQGSSLQLVFCINYPIEISIGDIFLMGATAAIAWQLPHEPPGPYRHTTSTLPKNDDVHKLYYTQTRESYVEHVNERNLELNKRSLLSESTSSDCNKNTKDDFDRQTLHELQKQRNYLNQSRMTHSSIKFHRHTKIRLYDKLDTFLSALGHDGRQCVQKVLCQIGQNKHEEQGTFLDEIVRAIFTLPTGTEFDKELHQEYDRAHGAQEDCELLYPKCKSSMKDIPFR